MIKEAETRKEFDLRGIVPWGRRYDEYADFFAFDELPPTGSILDVGGGPASFAAEAAERGMEVVACDPIYAATGDAIQRRFEETRGDMMAGLRIAQYRFNWKRYGSPDRIESLRRKALDIFLADFETRRRERYIPASLPELPFGTDAFQTALCSHLLFLYGDDLDAAFHVAAARELARVAHEVRIFPLLNLDGRPSSHLPIVMDELQEAGLFPQLVAVPFEFQRGATHMLRIRKE